MRKLIIVLLVALGMSSCGIQLTPSSYYVEPRPIYTNYGPRYYYPKPYYQIHYYGGYGHNYGHSHGHR